MQKCLIKQPREKNTLNPACVYTDRYRIVARYRSNWKKYNCARIHISIPLLPSYDERSRSIIDWAKQNFAHVTLCIHDTLQRYNLMALGWDEKQAYDKALVNGDDWLKANLPPSDDDVEVIRWDSLLAHKDYPSVHEKICRIYEEDKDFSDALDSDSAVFAERCQKRGEPFNSARIALSRAFLLEEVSGLVLLCQGSSAADVYSGSRMKAMQLLLDKKTYFHFKDNSVMPIKVFDRARPSIPPAKQSLPSLARVSTARHRAGSGR